AIMFGQSTPRAEVFLGYDYMRANSATNVPAFSLNGGSGQFAVNFNPWIGFLADMGAVHNGNISGLNTDTTVSHYLFGPRVTLHRGRVRPYLQILWGGAHLGTSTAVNLTAPPSAQNPIFIPGEGNLAVRPGDAISGRISHSQTAFGMTAGGGLEIR